VQLHNACGGLLFFFACLPKGSGSATKKNQKKTLPILSGQADNPCLSAAAGRDYSPFVGSSNVEQMCMVVKGWGSLMWCRDRSVEL